MTKQILILCYSLPLVLLSQNTEKSVAQQWMDVALRMIELDGQGPTIQARNLFHTAAAMYDAWAAYDKEQETYFLGKNYNGYHLDFNPEFKKVSKNRDSLIKIAVSYAAFNVIHYRYSQYGSKGRTIDVATNLMETMGYTVSTSNTDYENGSPEALGNYIAAHIIEFGKSDGSLEEESHQSESYEFINKNLKPEQPGVGKLANPNLWQPIEISDYVRVKGLDKTLEAWNYLLLDGNTQFLTFFWGDVFSFALPKDGKRPFLDPGSPPLFAPNDSMSTHKYRWGFQLVQDWSSYLDAHNNNNVWDISPKGITSLKKHLPTSQKEYEAYFLRAQNNDLKETAVNPFTQKKYPPNQVKQGDYCRVIAEFWVDGPNTKSPPGHWLQFLSDVSYTPNFEKKWNGKGEELPQLEWDIKSNFMLSGTLHDAAIACWSVKSHYNYVRPITAIRYLAGLGQSSKPELPNYHQNGLKLKKGSVELVTKNDPLVGKNKENLNKIKIQAWKGPDCITNPIEDTAGVGWILAENWWPYQRYMFATPPFAGYTSGHSTFSIAGAEILTYVTGTPYFPQGVKTFTAKKNEFLSFENGPSEDITLQWATYYDAAIQTCLSRIWGGIHPPIDDIEGRRMGKKIADNTIQFVENFMKK